MLLVPSVCFACFTIISSTSPERALSKIESRAIKCRFFSFVDCDCVSIMLFVSFPPSVSSLPPHRR